MNKRGFTLIELLAVIVILAIIALIATPIVLNIINESKESAQIRSAEMYLKGVETSVASSIIHEKNVTDGEHPITPTGDVCLGNLHGTGKTATCDGETLEVQMNGEKPTSGTVTIVSGKVTDISFTYSNGKTIVKDNDGKLVYEGSEENEEQKITLTPKKETYTIGEEVTISEENFYVIADDAEKITLLTKNNIDTVALVQSADAIKVAFSSTNYWSSETELPINLNEYPIPEGVTSIISTAKEYGTKVGGTGRLMTKDEAEALKTTNPDIFCEIIGKAESTTEISKYQFWLDTVYQVVGNVSYQSQCVELSGKLTSLLNHTTYSSSVGVVRPVVEISKSKLFE